MKSLADLGWCDDLREGMTLTAYLQDGSVIPPGQYICLIDAEGVCQLIRVSDGPRVTVRIQPLSAPKGR